MVEIFPSWTKVGSWSLGRDPLGMQATSVRIYRSLVPGLTNVTNRLRYFSFYCWAIEAYERTEHSADEQKWSRYIRRAEAAYAVACNVVDAPTSDGMAGGLWAKGLLDTLGTAPIDLKLAADSPGTAGQYLKAKHGNFGQFYIASMIDEGMLDRTTRVPIVSEKLGRKLARSFADSIGPAADLLTAAIRTGRVSVAALEAIGAATHPSRVRETSGEMQLLREYLLARAPDSASGTLARQSSAWLVLDLMRHGVDANDEHPMREAFYNRLLPDGSDHQRSGNTIERWRAFQANELCHIALEALLNALLKRQDSEHIAGIEPEALITEVVDPLMETAGCANKSWAAWAKVIGAEHFEREGELAGRVLETLRMPDELADDEESLVAAIQLLAVLWDRWSEGDGKRVREIIETFAQGGGKSLAGVLKSLDALAARDVRSALIQLIRQHVIADHLAIAGRKLSASGTFTYHFTIADGRMNDGRVSKYGYTTPRLRNLVRFLRDARLCNDGGPTPDGTRFLDEHRPL